MTSILVENDKVTFTDDGLHIQSIGFPTVGTILSWAGNNLDHLDSRYRFCNGDPMTTTTYPELFAVLGYRYGGSGTTFNLPDYRNRIPAGAQLTNAMKLDGITGASGGSHKMEQYHFPHSHPIETVNVNYADSYDVEVHGGNNEKRSDSYSSKQFKKTSTTAIDPYNATETATQTGTLPPYTLVTMIIKIT